MHQTVSMMSKHYLLGVSIGLKHYSYRSSTFNIIINDTVSIPLTLKGGPDTKGPTGDIKPGSFYGPSDALAIVNTLRSLGLAQAVPAPTASEEEKEHLAAFVQRLGSSRMVSHLNS